MCDYSLQLVASRPAKIGDKLVTTKFNNSLTGGFAGVRVQRFGRVDILHNNVGIGDNSFARNWNSQPAYARPERQPILSTDATAI